MSLRKPVKTYTKKDISHALLEKNEFLKLYEAEELVDDLFEIIRSFLMDQESEVVRIEIRNFGVFEVKPTKAKPKARNPRTNVVVHVPPRKKTHFKPGKILKDYLKESLAEIE